jgi:hypothetical protein
VERDGAFLVMAELGFGAKYGGLTCRGGHRDLTDSIIDISTDVVLALG